MGDTIGKGVLVLFWLAAVINLVQPFPGDAGFWMNVAAGVMAAAHVVECIIFSAKIRHNHDNALAGYLQVFLFGVLHVRGLKNPPTDQA